MKTTKIERSTGGAFEEAGAPTPAAEAMEMLCVFASVGATHFDVTLKDEQSGKISFDRGRTVNGLSLTLPSLLQRADAEGLDIIIRPRGKNETEFIQLDDLTAESVEKVRPFAFAVIETSRGNFQAWLCVTDAEETTARRLREATGADLHASRAVRLWASLKFNAIARAWYHRPRAHQSKRGQRVYLTALCGLGHWSRRIENFTEVQRQVYEALDQVIRASSAVECFNSVLRPYVSVKKHLSQGFLALIALYHNTHPLPQRGHQTPLQLAGVNLGDNDWVRLIEHEMRYGQAAAAQGK
jgi:hypothetical protein